MIVIEYEVDSQDLKDLKLSSSQVSSGMCSISSIYPTHLPNVAFPIPDRDQNEAQMTTTTNRMCLRDNRSATNHRTANRSMRDSN